MNELTKDEREALGELLEGWRDGLEGIEDRSLFGEVRSLCAEGDIYQAMLVASQIEHADMQDAAYEMLGEQGHTEHVMQGWGVELFGKGGVVYYIEPGANAFYPKWRTCLIERGRIWRFLNSKGLKTRSILRAMTIAEAEQVGACIELEQAPDAQMCKELGLRAGDFIRFDQQTYHFVGVSLAGVVWMVSEDNKFETQLAQLRKLKSKQLEARDQAAHRDSSRKAGRQLELIAS